MEETRMPETIALPQEPRRDEKFTAILFAGMVLIFCAWALSLPLFPTQDGPMHKYYVHALASLLTGSQDYHAYAIRHPFPPYATHYAVLLALTRFVSFDLAEKILVCMIFLCTAYGFRYCARSLGPSGNRFSLCAVPLLLHWSLVMGFLNYSLAIGLCFLAVGLWCRAAQGHEALWVFFALVSLLLAITHPVPLLLLIAFCSLDLLLRMVQGVSIRHCGRLCAALLFAGLCFLYPLASLDRSRSASNLHAFGLHRDALISSIALFGVSPFDTRSRNLFINGYRLGLVVLLVAGLACATVGVVARWRTRRLQPSDSMGLFTVALLLAIPILPPTMNGSDFFAQRLMIFPWLGALAAASQYAARGRLARVVRGVAMGFAIGLWLLTLAPAEMFFRPVARQLAAFERQPLPPHSEGLALLDPAMLKAVRTQHQLGFNPYLWSGALPFLRANAVMLNSPFMDQKITPLMPAPGGDLLVDRLRSPDEAERWINGNVDLPSLPPAVRSSLLASSNAIVFVGTPADVALGIGAVDGGGAAASFSCTSHTWYLVCLGTKR